MTERIGSISTFANSTALHLLVIWTAAKDLERDLCAQVGMFGEVDIGEAPAANDAEQAIAPDIPLLRYCAFHM